MRFGKKYSSRLLILHVANSSELVENRAVNTVNSSAYPIVQPTVHPTRCAFAVGKNVGNSVIRHRITRQLRHVMAERLALFPIGSQIVVRALPGAANASFAQLGENVDFALGKLLSE